MSATLEQTAKPAHGWLKKIRVVFEPGPMTGMLEDVTDNLLSAFEQHGHEIQDAPANDTDVLLTTARYGEPLGWRDAMLFSARRKFGLDKSPTIYTLIHVKPDEFERALAHFEKALAKSPRDPEDFQFPGLAPDAYRVLVEQGLRGGPIMAFERLLQAQSKSIRIVLVVGDDKAEEAYHFDLVGAHPRSLADDSQAFYSDIVMRIVTAASTGEVTEHSVLEPMISRAKWDALNTVEEMRSAALALDKRKFFTEMVRIVDLVQVPAVADSVASQYSEGCFATWEPHLQALIATVTGSARPVDKGNITEDDLAVIVGLQPDGSGAQVRHVEGKRNDPPSSEAVEMLDMDRVLPTITLDDPWDVDGEVPVVRSKLHGHRAIGGYDPEAVEYVPLDAPYYHYLVSCATEAQAQGIKEAFNRSEALHNPDDPRRLVFTVLPGHGCVIAEKWVAGKAPFQIMWEAMDAGQLQVINKIPQGPMTYEAAADGGMILKTAD
ncbi:MAG: hypothetical protein WBZ24_10090 [Anaerolineales bacterium]|jgi:hypothetical protein